MKTIDVRGKLCPEPLILTKRAIKEGAINDSFTVILDNDISTCNLENYLTEIGIKSHRESEGKVSKITFTLGGSPVKDLSVEPFCDITTATGGSYVVVIKSNSMGSDEDNSSSLGKILMRGFINSLASQDHLPKTIIMYNSGVLTAATGADTVDSLVGMAARGVDIILCGVCVDYYHIKDKLAVGRVSNMMEITKITTSAESVVYP